MHAARRSLEFLHAVVVVCLSVRAFFFLPVQVPTDSMAPTLRGHQIEDLSDAPAPERSPSRVRALLDLLARGQRHWFFTAQQPGTMKVLDGRPRPVLPGLTRQRLQFRSEVISLWNAPQNLLEAVGLEDGDEFQAGETLLHARTVSGDRLFVNRFAINFSHPKTGDIVVFQNQTLNALPKGVCFVKRLASLDNTTARPEFRSRPPSLVAGTHQGVSASPGHAFLLGDNRDVSFDSRDWGEIPNDWIIGRVGKVFWPLSPRCFKTPK